MASTLQSHDGSVEDQPFHIEQHGIDYIPETERWATARNIGALWAGTSINIEYFIYGALLMGFGFSFWTAFSIIVIGNLSYLLLGVASLQGPETGTTAFMVSRAPFGTRGSRILSFFNWITQLGFETEGLILIVGCVTVLVDLAGGHVNSPTKVILVILAAAIQAVMPYLGHATMVKVLRMLIGPFIAIFALIAYFAIKHGVAVGAQSYGHGWQIYTAGLAFTIALSGLGWTECGNDYTRYIPRDAKKGSIVWWMFLSTAVPEIIVMTLGAAVFTFLPKFGSGSNPFAALQGQHFIPEWVVVAFLVFGVVQLFGINSLDLYSSGVSLQALGLRLKRYQAVVLDSILAGVLTMWAVFQSTFSLYMSEFVAVIIVWIAPWFGILTVDWLMRHFRYSPSELQRNDSSGLYFTGSLGVNWSGLLAFVIGLCASMTCFSKAPSYNFPLHWMTPISNHFSGADFSVPVGILVGGLLYWAFSSMSGVVRGQVARQRELEPNR
ncbi:MAG TPA: cytosine permease [Acidimicrobiales bacterium]|nr:cytosine permease [Acidimicrobiales bacterium]